MKSKMGKIVAVIWAFVLTMSVFSGLAAPSVLYAAQAASAGSPPIWFILLPIFAFPLSVYFAGRSPFYHPKVAAWVNKRFGENTFEEFLDRLQPLLLFAICGFIQIGFMLMSGGMDRLSSSDLVGYGFFAAGCLGFLLAHFTLQVVQATQKSNSLPSALPIEKTKKQKASLKRLGAFLLAVFFGLPLAAAVMEYARHPELLIAWGAFAVASVVGGMLTFIWHPPTVLKVRAYVLCWLVGYVALFVSMYVLSRRH